MDGSGPSVRSRPTIHFHASPYGNFSFPQAHRKRKRSSNYSSDDDIDAYSTSHTHIVVPSHGSSPDDSEGDHRAKRLRRTRIEREMGEMTLQAHGSPVSSSGASFTGSSAATGHWTLGSSSINNLNHVSEPGILEIDEAFIPRGGLDLDEEIGIPQVEEASSPTSKPPENGDINMKGTSWFEPEKDRIVITDIDEFNAEEDDMSVPAPPSEPSQYWDDEEKRYKPYEISPAYLLRFSGMPKSAPIPPKPEDSLALVAYRPLPFTLPHRPDDVEEPTTSEHFKDATVLDPIEIMEDGTTVGSQTTIYPETDQDISEGDAMDVDE